MKNTLYALAALTASSIAAPVIVSPSGPVVVAVEAGQGYNLNVTAQGPVTKVSLIVEFGGWFKTETFYPFLLPVDNGDGTFSASFPIGAPSIYAYLGLPQFDGGQYPIKRTLRFYDASGGTTAPLFQAMVVAPGTQFLSLLP